MSLAKCLPPPPPPSCCSDLVGGICSVTLGDEEARSRGCQKSILERKAPPTFPLVIEMRERAHWVTHWVEDSVDCLLSGKVPIVQVGGSVGGWVLALLQVVARAWGGRRGWQHLREGGGLGPAPVHRTSACAAPEGPNPSWHQVGLLWRPGGYAGAAP